MKDEKKKVLEDFKNLNAAELVQRPMCEPGGMVDSIFEDFRNQKLKSMGSQGLSEKIIKLFVIFEANASLIDKMEIRPKKVHNAVKNLKAMVQKCIDLVVMVPNDECALLTMPKFPSKVVIRSCKVAGN